MRPQQRQEQIRARTARKQQAAAHDRTADVRAAAQALVDHKAHGVVVLDLRRLNDATDFFVIASGTSDTHVRSSAERVMDALRARGLAPHHLEGLPQGRWALLDFVDFVVHVFHPTLRDFYQLERLWADAPTLTLAEEAS